MLLQTPLLPYFQYNLGASSILLAPGEIMALAKNHYWGDIDD